MVILLVGMAVLLVLSGTFSGSEAAMFSLRKGELLAMRSGQDRLGHLVVRLLERNRQLLLTILIGNNIINVLFFSLAAVLGAQLAGGQGAAVLIIALSAMIVCGEIVPKVIMTGHPRFWATVMALPMALAMTLFAPLCWIVEAAFGRRLQQIESRYASVITPDELKLVIESSRDAGVVSERVRDRLIEIMDMTNLTVHEVMTHRTECCIIPRNASWDDARENLRAKPSPYVLVVDTERNEDCVGILAAQHLLRGEAPGKRMRKPLYIPEYIRLPQALKLFRDRKRTYGVVVDEYGGTAGLLTLAHIGVELLGESGTSEDVPEVAPAEALPGGGWRLSGQLPIAAWEPLIDRRDIGDARTLGGFMLQVLGHIPKEGERIRYGNLVFRIEQVVRHRIHSIVVEPVEVRPTVVTMLQELG